MKSLVEIRRVTYIKINQCIDLINELSKTIDPNTEIITKKEEDKNKISLPYLSDSIQLCEKLVTDLKYKLSLVEYLSIKNNECIDKYILILEKSK